MSYTLRVDGASLAVSGSGVGQSTQVGLGAVLARAGEGTIQEVVGHSEWVAKIFHVDLKDRAAKCAKVAAMITSPPPGAVQSDGFAVLTWPLHVVDGDEGRRATSCIGWIPPMRWRSTR